MFQQYTEAKKLIHDRLFIVEYFNEPEACIQLFFTGNAHFLKQAWLDLEDLREKEKAVQLVPVPWRSNSVFVEKIHEAEEEELVNVLIYKFEFGKIQFGFKTIRAFARYEYKKLDWQWKMHYDGFPILKQYMEFLQRVADGSRQIDDIDTAIPSGTLPLLHSLENKVYKPMPMSEVVEQLQPLTTRLSKNGKPFLTEEQLDIFIRRAFTGEKGLKKQKFNYAHGEKGLIIQLFYLLFVRAVTQYGEKNQKDKYIRLVSEHFTNWDYDSVAAFFKPNKTKQTW